MRVEQRWEGGGIRVKDRWSLSGVVPPLSLFLTPSWVLHLFPVTSPESYLICFSPPHLSSAPFIISSFSPSVKDWTRIFTNVAARYLFKPFLPLPRYLSSALLSVFLLTKSTWKYQETLLWLSFWPLLTQHVGHWRDLGFVGANKTTRQKGSDWQLWPMNSEYFLNIIWFWDPSAGSIVAWMHINVL